MSDVVTRVSFHKKSQDEPSLADIAAFDVFARLGVVTPEDYIPLFGEQDLTETVIHAQRPKFTIIGG